MSPLTPQRPEVRPPKQILPPDWIAGFVDGEGCFHIGVAQQEELEHGFQILPEFTVVQHERDIALLHRLRTSLGCGVVRRNAGDRFCLRVRNLEHLARFIVPFFERHPLRSKKAVDFRKFARIVRWMIRGEHRSLEGAKRILRFAADMNRGEREAVERALQQLDSLGRS